MIERPEVLQRQRPVQPMCEDVLMWPEFQALMRRLGVPNHDTSYIQITLAGKGVPVQVAHHYLAVDTQGMPLPPPNDLSAVTRPYLKSHLEQQRRPDPLKPDGSEPGDR